MTKKSNIIISLLFIILSLNYISSQNIITSWHYDKVQMYELETIGEILSSLDLSKINFENIAHESIEISNIKLISLQHSLYDSYLNYKTGLYIFGPDKISLSFSFDYKSDTQGTASFDLKINILKIRIKNNKEKQESTVSLMGYITEDGFNIFDVEEALKNKIKQALYKGFDEKDFINNNILSKINIIQYYKDKYSKKSDFIFESSDFFDKKEINIKLNRFIYFSEDVEGKMQKALSYYSGELGTTEDKVDRSSIPLKNERFLNSIDTYNMFINKNLIDIIGDYIIKDLKEKIYDKNTPKKTLPYVFTVNSLKKYFKGLDSFDNNSEFSTNIKITYLDNQKTKFNVKFIIQNKEVFSINVELELKLNLSLIYNIRLNLCLSDVNDIKINISGGSVQILDEEGLKSAIKESFDFENIPLCLSDKGISLRDYYAIIHNVEMSEEGYYIEGDQLYQ